MSRRHCDLTPSSPPQLDFLLDLLHRFVNVPSRIIGQAQCRMVDRLLAGSSLNNRVVALVDLLDEPRFGGTREETHDHSNPNNAVKIDASPDFERVAKIQGDEWRSREAEGCLRGKVGDDIIVWLVLCRFRSIGAEEEGSNISTNIYDWSASGRSVRCRHTLRYSLDEGRQDERKIVAWIEAMPKSTGEEGR